MGVVRVKAGVQFTTIAPGGFRILAGLDNVCRTLPFDFVITSACDGEHSGPVDPHHRGEAYDVRSHDLPDKEAILGLLKKVLEETYFFFFLEDEGSSNEHIHIQVRKGTIYPSNDSEEVSDAALGAN